MRQRKRNKMSVEEICIRKIELGIESIKTGKRKAENVVIDLETLFTKLETTNQPMFEDLWSQYCLVRLEISGVVST